MARLEPRRIALSQPVPAKAAGSSSSGESKPPEVVVGTSELGSKLTALQTAVDRSLNENIELEELFPIGSGVDWTTIMAVRAQLVQGRVKKMSHLHKEKIRNYADRYRRGEDIVHIAKSIRFPPYLLLKMLIPELIPKANAKKPLEVAEKAGDIRLRANVFACEAADIDYAPAADRVRHACGDEYEFKLQRELRAMGIIFQHEDDLRVSGFSKTPDALLTIPIGIQLSCLEDPFVVIANKALAKDRVISWIDSKAMFGDFHTHTKSNKDQIQAYVNRFGPGMVIYWFGFDPHVSHAYPDVLVVSRFPVEAVVQI